ncbi:hypothetical protein BV25DRAFT_1843181 [Artomyces pyxidatus]|uniref:Uncharacterized protein n=1 Tax=Artomyces pyxidatus TaxID=48021 RepID=A0ACB8SFZ4_9AGAM|nr:hypothetical protein BV25DRAFT_1843181 [Artomyces pyxidatus]
MTADYSNRTMLTEPPYPQRSGLPTSYPTLSPGTLRTRLAGSIWHLLFFPKGCASRRRSPALDFQFKSWTQSDRRLARRRGVKCSRQLVLAKKDKALRRGTDGGVGEDGRAGGELKLIAWAVLGEEKVVHEPIRPSYYLSNRSPPRSLRNQLKAALTVVAAPTVPCCDVCIPHLMNQARSGPKPTAATSTMLTDNKREKSSRVIENALCEWQDSVPRRDKHKRFFTEPHMLPDETVDNAGRVSAADVTHPNYGQRHVDTFIKAKLQPRLFGSVELRSSRYLVHYKTVIGQDAEGHKSNAMVLPPLELTNSIVSMVVAQRFADLLQIVPSPKEDPVLALLQTAHQYILRLSDLLRFTSQDRPDQTDEPQNLFSSPFHEPMHPMHLVANQMAVSSYVIKLLVSQESSTLDVHQLRNLIVSQTSQMTRQKSSWYSASAQEVLWPAITVSVNTHIRALRLLALRWARNYLKTLKLSLEADHYFQQEDLDIIASNVKLFAPSFSACLDQATSPYAHFNSILHPAAIGITEAALRFEVEDLRAVGYFRSMTYLELLGRQCRNELDVQNFCQLWQTMLAGMLRDGGIEQGQKFHANLFDRDLESVIREDEGDHGDF